MRVVSRKLKFFAAIAAVCLSAFFISGYWMSDDKYFNDLVEANDLDTPEKAFTFVNENTEFVSGNPRPEINTTPRYMLQKRHLWCDESAMVLAIIADKVGNKTRLVDVVKENGVAGHTYLQIYENDEWINYDTVLKKSHLTHEEILRGYDYAKLKGYPQPRSYPRLYNRIIHSNYFLKQLALWLRNAPG